jgi:hypothetical protein
MPDKRIEDIEAKIAELKARWPRHGVKMNMWQELEDLEDALEAAKQAHGEDDAR